MQRNYKEPLVVGAKVLEIKYKLDCNKILIFIMSIQQSNSSNLPSISNGCGVNNKKIVALTYIKQIN